MIYLGIYLGIGLITSLTMMVLAHLYHIREISRSGIVTKIVAVIITSFIWPVCLFMTIKVLITEEEKTQ